MALEHGVCNQLQFNLGNTGLMNVSSRFRDPQPLVIEKIGSSSAHPTNMNSPADVNLNLLNYIFYLIIFCGLQISNSRYVRV